MGSVKQTVTVVIPTRNRPASLHRLLKALHKQTMPANEIIVADASDDPLNKSDLKAAFPQLPLQVFHTEPSVCRQRNLAIREATSKFIFLCDDDIEPPVHYIETLLGYLAEHPEAGAVTGEVVEVTGEELKRFHLPVVSSGRLLYGFIFQQTQWVDLPGIKRKTSLGWLFSMLERFYRRRGNTITLAGWPLISKPAVDGVLRTTIYGIGASIIRRDWLLAAPYDELLDPHGIGDNYGVAINFPQKEAIHVLEGIDALHYKEQINRRPYPTIYFRRVLALHYFMHRYPRFSWVNRLSLAWSLIGNLLGKQPDSASSLRRATLKALGLIITGKNPYLLAHRSGMTGPISPEL